MNAPSSAGDTTAQAQVARDDQANTTATAPQQQVETPDGRITNKPSTAPTNADVPATTANEGEYTQSYTYTIPANFNVDRCRVVAFAHEYSNNYKSGKNEVLNAVSVPLNGTRTQNATPSVYTNINAPESAVTRLSVYPNPANDVIYLDYIMNGDAATSFEIYDIMGKLVSSIPTMEQSAGNYTISVATNNFANGVYFVVAKNNSQTAGSIKFVINR